MAEEWKTIPDHPEYEVSNEGRVRSHKFGRVKYLKPQANVLRGNYLHFTCITDGVRAQFKVHCIVAELFIGPRPEGLDIRHLDGNSQNNEVGNLKYGTRLENERDKFRHGTRVREAKPYCRNGHDYTPENTYYSNGTRFCKACSRARYAANAEENARKARERRWAKKQAA